MKGTKEEDKIARRPLFPRLHVNDTDKGGPRAPPRNKMALYEQFSIPSQRFSPTQSVRPLPNNSTPSNSSSQGYVNERNVFSPFYMSSNTSNHVAKTSRPSDVVLHDMPQVEHEKRYVNRSSSKNSVGTRSIAEDSSLCGHDKSTKVSCQKQLHDMDDFRVPTFDESGNTLMPKRDAPVTEPVKSNARKQASASLSSSSQCPASNNKSSEQTRTSNMKLQTSDRTHYLKRTKEALLTEGPREKFASQKILESTKIDITSSDEDEISNFHSADKSICKNTVVHLESCHDGDPVHLSHLNDNAKVVNADTTSIINDVFCRDSPNKIHGGSRPSANLDKGDVSKENGSRNMERKDEAFEASVVDTIVHFDISPDDVVGLIGPKHFWKARRAIVNQQRVFAIQVFELHRIIKVQKLIAASPHLLLEGNLYLNKSPIKKPTKMPLSEFVLNSELLAVKEKDDSLEPHQNVQPITKVTSVREPTQPSCQNVVDGSLQGQLPKITPSPGNSPAAPTVPDNKLSPWCFHPPANQWLIPVMSPSEGLVYKPYAGHCQPGGFMAPVYGSCTHFGISPAGGDFMNPAYGVLPRHQPPNVHLLSNPTAIPPNYFPTPYGFPTMNPIISPSAVEQVSYLGSSQPNGQVDQHSRNSCNILQPRNEASSGRLRKLMASKDSEVHGSTGSSPFEKSQVEGKDALQLFPMTSSGNDLTHLSGKDGQTCVIKVVPHNPRSATESAARIFQSIQEERQQQDL